MWTLLHALDSFLDIFLAPLDPFPPIWGLTGISLLVGVVMVLLYRVISDQKAIGKIRDQIKVHFMEVLVYKEDIAQTWIAQRKILAYNFKYMALSLKPGLILLVLVVFILAPLHVRYGYLPLKPEDSFIVTVQMAPGKSPMDVNVALKAPEAIEVETPPLRLEEEREVNWRLRPKKAGEYVLQFLLPESVCGSAMACTLSKQVVVGSGEDGAGLRPPLRKIAPERRQGAILAALYNPLELPLPENSVLKAIKISYPPRSFRGILGGWSLDWLVLFIVVSLGFGFLVKKLLKIA